MAVLNILLLQITSKPNLTFTYVISLVSPTLTLPRATIPSPLLHKDLQFLHLMQDVFLKSSQNLAKYILGPLKYTSVPI